MSAGISDEFEEDAIRATRQFTIPDIVIYNDEDDEQTKTTFSDRFTVGDDDEDNAQELVEKFKVLKVGPLNIKIKKKIVGGDVGRVRKGRIEKKRFKHPRECVKKETNFYHVIDKCQKCGKTYYPRNLLFKPDCDKTFWCVDDRYCTHRICNRHR